VAIEHEGRRLTLFVMRGPSSSAGEPAAVEGGEPEGRHVPAPLSPCEQRWKGRVYSTLARGIGGARPLSQSRAAISGYGFRPPWAVPAPARGPRRRRGAHGSPACAP
jgi:hypothetical protein